MNTPNDGLMDGFDEAIYPVDFLAQYEPMECLSFKQESETLYVKNRVSGEFAVAKCYTDKSLLSGDAESRILRALNHKDLPRYLGEYENDTMLCVIREYVKGVPLSEVLEEAPLTGQEAISVLVQLCDILTYLHSQSPPVIHRDLKPQNIILTDEGTVKLIDFGISRLYDTNAKRDTVFYGTQEFAPPEQYGFSQTDSRSDLFSLGMVMGYMLTGKTDVESAAASISSKSLARVYCKCTNFSPRNRYASAKEFKFALLRSDTIRSRRMTRVCASALACCLCVCAGFAIGRYTNILTPLPYGVVFREPLIERAVRLQLGKTDNEPIKTEDLLSVTELYIFGSDILAKTEEEMNSAADRLFAENKMKTGPIKSLTDLEKMPNLQKVAVAMQQVSDLTPLAKLTQLRTVIVKNNPIESISPLCGLKHLERLSVFDALVADFTPLAACSRLTDLDAGGTLASTPAAFAGIHNLTRLNLHKLTLDTLDGIENFPRLQIFELGGIVNGNLSPLLALPKLETVVLNDQLREKANEIKAKAQFTIEYR